MIRARKLRNGLCLAPASPLRFPQLGLACHWHLWTSGWRDKSHHRLVRVNLLHQVQANSDADIGIRQADRIMLELFARILLPGFEIHHISEDSGVGRNAKKQKWIIYFSALKELGTLVLMFEPSSHQIPHLRGDAQPPFKPGRQSRGSQIITRSKKEVILLRESTPGCGGARVKSIRLVCVRVRQSGFGLGLPLLTRDVTKMAEEALEF